MLFDCFGLFIGLVASYISKLPPNNYYTYGYGRVETLSGFFNGLLLVFTAFNVLSESVDRILEPQNIDTSGALLPVSCIGFVVNMIGVFCFHDVEGHHHEEEED
jgi:zinc transporter 5/7